MTDNHFPIEKFKSLETPFYFYDTSLLQSTLKELKEAATKHDIVQHYAIKANSNHELLKLIAAHGFGADCVSGNEINAAFNAGFPPSKIVFAGVGKTDKEINHALDLNISCFNTESLPEIEVINTLAQKKGKIANIALRINPDVDAHTHEYITTGLKENKFGFSRSIMFDVIGKLKKLEFVNLIGLHFHIGSNIHNLDAYKFLCERVNEIQNEVEAHNISLSYINLGGGLGIDYDNPDLHPIPDFDNYLSVLRSNLQMHENQEVHVELGRAVVGQCGSLITKVLYVKQGEDRQFVIVDAGMTELIRPALYQAYHKVENITSNKESQKYDVVGPICESSDTFVKEYDLPATQRGDLLAIRSAGAYGEVMASQYNCRELPKTYFSDKL